MMNFRQRYSPSHLPLLPTSLGTTDNLTKKLKELVMAYGDDVADYFMAIEQGQSTKHESELTEDAVVEQIKQAFIDDGWVKPITLDRDQSYDATKNPVYKTATLMPREEWEARAKDDGWVKATPLQSKNSGDTMIDVELEVIIEDRIGKTIDDFNARGQRPTLRFTWFGNPMVTGNYWYNKFEEELEANQQYGDKVAYMWNTGTVLEAAKKAAGIES